jgi:O-acetyl-ADP-ribose deacetylase (regulator of RNase III)
MSDIHAQQDSDNRRDHPPELIEANRRDAASEFVVGFNPKKFSLHCGNILDVEAEAIVNAANEGLCGGGGIDGVIHAACGPALLEECMTIPAGPHGERCLTGQSVITGAGQSHFKHVIHTVGPYLDENDNTQPHLLRSCYRTALQLCKSHNIKSVVFPCISTGYYGYPMKEAAEIALDEISRWTEKNDIFIYVAVFNSTEQTIYKKLLGSNLDSQTCIAQTPQCK